MTKRIEQPAPDSEPSDQLAEARDQLEALVAPRIEALEKAIRERPLMAVGIGVGIGFLLARLLRD